MATIASVIVSLAALVCFILIIVKIFQHGETTMGIVCIVTIFCGIGGIIALIYGWIKAGEWNMTNLMIAYTACFILSIVLGVMSGPVVDPNALPAP